MLEMLLSEYTKQLLESYQSVFTQLASQLRWLYFDEDSRLMTRVVFLDDGWIRVRVDGASALDINLVEVLRELSWGLYSVAEVGRNVDMLKNALESVGVDRLRVVGDLTVSEMNVTRVSGVALTGRDWSADLAKLQNLDVSLTTQAILKRWGKDVTPFWVLGSELTAPAANTALVSQTVTSGKTGFVYGLIITAGEANDFKLNWTSGGTARSVRFTLASKGSVVLISPVALNEGLPADGGSSITITNVNAGSTGIVYQATLLYAEV
jgi:hypothetical protein